MGAEAPYAAEGCMLMCMQASPSAYSPLQRTALPCSHLSKRKSPPLEEEKRQSQKNPKIPYFFGTNLRIFKTVGTRSISLKGWGDYRRG